MDNVINNNQIKYKLYKLKKLIIIAITITIIKAIIIIVLYNLMIKMTTRYKYMIKFRKE
jgi:hypothetical protein